MTDQTPPSDHDEHRRDDARRDLSAYGRAAGMAYIGLGALLVSLLGGWLIDRAAGTSPLWTVVCSLAGIGLGIYLIIREGSRW